MSQFGGNKVETIFTGENQVGPAADAASNDINKVDKAATKANTSFGDGIKKSIGAITSFVGAITAALGVATLFFNLGRRFKETWVDAFQSATEANEKFLLSLGTAPQQGLDKIRDEISRLQGELAERLQSGQLNTPISRALGEQEKLEQRIRELQRAELAFATQLEAQKNASQKKDEEAAASRQSAIENEIALEDVQAGNRERRAGERAARFEQEQADQIRQFDAELDAAREKYHKDQMERIRKESDARLEAIQRERDELRALNSEREQGLGLDQAGVLGINRNSALVDIIGRRGGR